MNLHTIEQRLVTLIESGDTFTADDVTMRGADTTGNTDPNDSQNAIGALIRRYSKAGAIEVVGYAKSQSPRRKGGLVRQWRAVNEDGDSG